MATSLTARHSLHLPFNAAATRKPRYASLYAMTMEGALANMFVILTGGAFLTGLALHWGADDFMLGLLGAIPFLAQIAQLPGAMLIAVTGRRKSITVAFLAIARQSWWLLIPLCFLDIPYRPQILATLAILSGISAMIAAPGWTAWIADLVPSRLRGRYFGIRSMAVAISTVTITIAASLILDGFSATGNRSLGFAILLAMAATAAAMALAYLARIPDTWSNQSKQKITLTAVAAPFGHSRFRRLLTAGAAWHVAIGLSAAFFAPHMLNELRMNFLAIGLYTSAFSLAAVWTTHSWGKAIDRFGARQTAVVSAVGISIIPLIWLFPGPNTAWVLYGEALYSGILWAGFNLAVFTLPISCSDKSQRCIYLAIYAVTTGLAYFGASILGGYLAQVMGDQSITVAGLTLGRYQILFAISAFLRMAVIPLFNACHEPRDTSLPILLNFIGDTALKRLSAGRLIVPFGIKTTDLPSLTRRTKQNPGD